VRWDLSVMPELHELTRRLQGARWSVALLFGPGAGLAVGYLVHSSARALIPPGEQNYDDVISWDFGPATLAAIATTARCQACSGNTASIALGASPRSVYSRFRCLRWW
jgi:hypothetical protein